MNVKNPLSVSLATPQVPSLEELNALPELWREAPRRWGHPLHSLCSYFAMFPPRLARVFIEWLTMPGDAVYDPFSGRGTVALEATLLGRTSYSSDANPLAWVLSQAKTSIPSAAQVEDRLQQLETAYRSSKSSVKGVPDDIRMLYSDGTLRQLCFLRSQLDKGWGIDAFIAATVLGIMHANHAKSGATRGLSISMPNTFAMSPGYVKRYIAEHDLKRPNVDVFEMIRRRISRLELPATPVEGGRAWLQDAEADPPDWLLENRVKLVFSSPPYLQVIKYGKYNWVRLWFLGEDPRNVDAQLMASASLTRYLTFMKNVCSRLGEVVTTDGYVCLVIGDVRRGDDGGQEPLNLAHEVWEHAAQPLGWQLHGIVADDLPVGQKVSRIWKNNSGRATKTDRLLIMSPHPASLPPLVRPIWENVTFQQKAGVA
jgi:hypothetical protein